MGMFSFNANAGETPETLKQKRAVADALLQQGLDMSPIQHPMQGLARIAQALSGNYARAWTDKKEAEGRKSAGDSFSKIMAAIWPGQAPAADTGPSFAAPPTRSSDMPPHAGDTFSKMVQIESGGNPNAVSPKGATGIAQIMPATARDPGFGLSNIFDFAKSRGVNVADNSDATLQGLLRNPEINRAFGQAYFEKMKELNGGDERLAAASYNAGPGAVQKAGGVPNIPETQAYVGKLGLNGQQPAQAQPAAYQRPGAPQPAQAQGMPQIAQVFELLNNPYLNEGQKAVLGQVIKREFDRADPQTQLQIQAMMQGLEKGKLEIDALKNPAPKYEQVGDSLVRVGPDGVTPIYQAPLSESDKLAREKWEYEKAAQDTGTWEKLSDGALYNKKTSEIKSAPVDTLPGADFKDVSTLRKEVQDTPQIKNYMQAAPIYRSMVETAGRNTRASDLNLVYGLGKIFDPTSVVREGEMIMVKNTASVPDWYQDAVSVFNGQSGLTPELRAKIMTEAKSRMDAYGAEAEALKGQYEGIASRHRINLADIWQELPVLQDFKPATNVNGYTIEAIP